MLATVMNAVGSATLAVTGSSPWWAGVPTKLIRKRTLVQSNNNNNDDDYDNNNQHQQHLPVHTLTFKIPSSSAGGEGGNNLTGRAIPHSSIRLDLGDVIKMVIPNYKPKSYSVSALREKELEFDVTLKVYPNGRASGYIDRLQVGDEINTFGMKSGRHRNPGAYVGIIAYGVGMTEALPVARAELAKGDVKRVKLLWASRTMEDTFWHDEIAELSRLHPDTFEIIYILSRQKKDGCLYGRVDSSVLQEVFNLTTWSNTTTTTTSSSCTSPEEARFLSVGTKEMMSLTDNLIAGIGFPMPKHALLPKPT